MYIAMTCFSSILAIYALCSLYKSLCTRIDEFKDQHADYNQRLEKLQKSLNTLLLQHRVWEEKFKDMSEDLTTVGSNTRLLRSDLQTLLVHTNRLFSDCLSMVYDDAPNANNVKSTHKWRS